MRIENDFGFNRTVTEVLEVLNNLIKNRKGRVMFSMVQGDGSVVFRCWEGPFWSVMPQHFDSCGRNLLFGCFGDCYEMSEFIESFEALKEYCKWKMSEKEGTGHTIWVGLVGPTLK